MELKDNTHITYDCSSKLTKWVVDWEKENLYSTLFILLIYVIFSYKMYQQSDSVTISIIAILGLSPIILLTFYASIIKQPRIISHTIASVTFNKELVEIKTFTYKIFKIFVINSKSIKYELEQIKITEKPYPLLDKKHLGSNKVLVFQIEEKNYYLLREFYDLTVNSHFNKL